MNNVWLTLLPAAIGFAVSPAPLIELILVLFSKRRVVNSIAFIVTLLVAGGAVVALGALGGKAADGNDSSTTSTLMAWILLALGLLLLVIGVRNWRNRKDTSEPKVFATISGMGPVMVAVLAFGVVAVNPKNTVLLLAAGQTVSQTTAPLFYGAAFLLIGCLPYLLAVGYALLGGDRASARLDQARAWLVANNRFVMAIVCLILGVVLGAKGLTALL